MPPLSPSFDNLQRAKEAVLAVGDVLGGRYEILEQVASGAMGAVYRGRHVRLGRAVAVKVMAEHLAGDERVVARFNREAETMSALRHPNIAEILDYDTTEGGVPYLVLEYLHGQTLESYLAAQPQLDLRTIVSLAKQIGDALASAHDAEIVHRDLKPANVIIQSTSEGPFAKLLDFGISKRASVQTPERRALTGEFEVMGTPTYMAPEQAAGKTALLDARGDQYSFAVLIYEMLTGRTPFESEDIMDLLFSIIHTEPAPPSVFRADTPWQIDRVILRALSKNPEERFFSVREMLASLYGGVERSSLPMSLERGALERGSIPPKAMPTLPPGGTPSVGRAPSLPPEFFRQDTKSAPTEREIPGTEAQSQIRSTDLRRKATSPDLREQARSRSPKVTEAHIHDELDRARGECLLGNVTLALCYLRAVVAESRQMEAEEPHASQSALDEAVRLLRGVVKNRLGGSESYVRSTVDVSHLESLAGMEREDVYVLSRVDGAMTLEEIEDVSPLPLPETWCSIAHLVSSGLLARTSAPSRRV